MVWSKLLDFMMPSDPEVSEFRPLASESDWSDARAQSDDTPVLIFKHSTACPVSARAQREMQDVAAEPEAPPVYRLVVQKSRALSNRIAQALDIRHETPQVIVLRSGVPVFDTSHSRVRADTLREVLAEQASAEDASA